MVCFIQAVVALLPSFASPASLTEESPRFMSLPAHSVSQKERVVLTTVEGALELTAEMPQSQPFAATLPTISRYGALVDILSMNAAKAAAPRAFSFAIYTQIMIDRYPAQVKYIYIYIQ